MHRKWLNSSGDNKELEDHLKLEGFEEALKSLRNRAAEIVESTARIPLPFSVQTQNESKHNLVFRDTSLRMLYLDL